MSNGGTSRSDATTRRASPVLCERDLSWSGRLDARIGLRLTKRLIKPIDIQTRECFWRRVASCSIMSKTGWLTYLPSELSKAGVKVESDFLAAIPVMTARNPCYDEKNPCYYFPGNVRETPINWALPETQVGAPARKPHKSL